MSDFIFVAVNARYSHTSMSIRTLRANLAAERHDRCELVEFTIQNDVAEAANLLLSRSPKLIGISVYLWGVAFARQLVEILRMVRPSIYVVIGGPEIQEDPFNAADPLYRLSDACIVGEGEEIMDEICAKVDSGALTPKKLGSDPNFIHTHPVDIQKLVLPYDEFSDDDLLHRVLYVESSRGCPYRCAFCLSANDKPVRTIPLERLFPEFEALIRRGARAFKFLDRTLNASVSRTLALLDFFLPFAADGIQLHFEMTPHEIPDALIEKLAQFPPAAIQIEFGVQTLNDDVARLISRRLEAESLLRNLTRLRRETGAHIHADLIAGLPGENFEMFADGFERLRRTGVQEIQLGILKRLKSSPLDRQAEAWGLKFSVIPPYEILETPDMSFEELTQFKRFAKFWDTLVNNANFPKTVHAICRDDAFREFWRMTNWIYGRTTVTQGISQTRWVSVLFEYMTTQAGFEAREAAMLLLDDYLMTRKEDIPPILRPHVPADFSIASVKRAKQNEHGRQRQAKHLITDE